MFSVLLTADMVYSCVCERRGEKEEGRISLVYLNKSVNSLESCVKDAAVGVQPAGSDWFNGLMTRERRRVVPAQGDTWWELWVRDDINYLSPDESIKASEKC